MAKWVLVGRLRPSEHPLWSSFVWRNELADTFVEVVVRDAVGEVPVPGDQVVALHGSGGGGRHDEGVSGRHGATGLPIHLVRSGTDSPLITSDPGPTVLCRPRVAAGRTMLLGPKVAPVRRVTVSMLSNRSWKRWVCTTHPGLTVAPSSTVTRSISGSQ